MGNIGPKALKKRFSLGYTRLGVGKDRHIMTVSPPVGGGGGLGEV